MMGSSSRVEHDREARLHSHTVCATLEVPDETQLRSNLLRLGSNRH